MFLKGGFISNSGSKKKVGEIMNKELKVKLCNVLKTEFDYIVRNEDDEIAKIEKMFDIRHMIQIIENFEKIEPIISNYMNEKTDREKFNR